MAERLNKQVVQRVENLLRSMGDQMMELAHFRSGYGLPTPKVDENISRLGEIRSILETALYGNRVEITLKSDETGQRERVLQFDPNNNTRPEIKPSERGWWRGFRARSRFVEQLGSLPDRPADAEGGHEVRS